MTSQNKQGFTIVELLVVIVVIGILAGITIVAYNGIQQRARNAALSSDLSNAAGLMEIAYATSDPNTFPSTIPSDMKLSSGVGMSLASTGSTGSYCINAQIPSGNDLIRMYYDSTTAEIAPGVCSGATIAGSETGVMKPNIITTPEFTSGWTMSLSVAGQAMTTRAGATGDPYPTKPVLIWTNNVSRTTTWAVVAGSVDHTKIIAGKTYQATYWVRKTGTGFTGTTNVYGVMDGGTQNKALNTGASQTVNTSWTKVTGSSVALANAISTNKVYLVVSTAPFPTTGWTLEFQGFELLEQ